MLEISLNHKQNEEEKILNQKEIIDLNNENKLSLRKDKNFSKLKKIRNSKLDEIKIKYYNIKPEFCFKINNLKDSFDKIFFCLNSNNKDLISYSLNELRIYFSMNGVSMNDKEIIIEKNFFDILLFLGNKLIEINDSHSIENILNILINIQYFEKGSSEYLKKLYCEPYFEFYNKCYLKKFDKEFDSIDSIKWIILNMSVNDKKEEFNLIFLRSSIYTSFLNYIEEENVCLIGDRENSLIIINYATNLLSSEDLLEKNDIKIITKSMDILINNLYGTNNEVILGIIYNGLFNISQLDNSFHLNKRLVDEGVTVKILYSKFKDYQLNEDTKRVLINAFRIIANNLTLSDKDCKIIYDNNIIDYYNNILEKFDYDYNILYTVISGLANIAASSYKYILDNSLIFNDKNIEKYLNTTDDIKKSYLKIIKFLLYNSNDEILAFIYDKKILQYFMYLFCTSNLNQKIYVKIIKVIDQYLKRFNSKTRESEQFQMIYFKFKDLFQHSNKINNLNKQELISSIEKNIENKYNY